MNTVDMVSVGDVAAALTPNLDGDDAPPFKDEVTSFQVLIGGAAELNVHLLNEIKKKHIFSIDLNTVDNFLLLSFPTFPLLSMADAVWTVSPCRP